MNTQKPIITESDRIYNKAKKIVPCQTQTLSKAPFNYVDGVSPKYLKKGKGCHVWDVDGNEYIDYGMALGPISLGYCYDEVDNAIKEQLKDAINLTLMHPLEVEVSELLINVIPCAEMVRFGKNGSDVTACALALTYLASGLCLSSQYGHVSRFVFTNTFRPSRLHILNISSISSKSYLSGAIF